MAPLSLAMLASTSLWQTPPHEIREVVNTRIMSIEGSTANIYKVKDTKIDDIPVRIYVPSEKKVLAAIFFIHGGAFVGGNLDTHDNLARYLATKTACEVVSVGYSLSPEAKFPKAIEECYKVLTCLSKDFSKIIVVGDSSGGNIAAALCILARDKNGPQPVLQVLINPVLDLTCNGVLTKQNDALDVARWQVKQYISDPKDTFLPLVSPLLLKDFKGLPQALIIVAEDDELKAQGEAFNERLKEANVPTELYCQQNTGHLAGDAARASTKALPSLDVAVRGIIQNLSKQ